MIVTGEFPCINKLQIVTWSHFIRTQLLYVAPGVLSSSFDGSRFTDAQ